MLILRAVYVFAIADFFQEVVDSEDDWLLLELPPETQVVVNVFAKRD
jgi:hypothetical protein